MRARGALGLLLLCACEGASSFSVEEPPAPTEAVPDSPVSDRAPTDWGRVARRLSVAQLKASFDLLFAVDDAGEPVGWRTPEGADAFAVNAMLLGEPDWLVSTAENLDPTLLYAKLLDDAARQACDRTLALDMTRPEPQARVLLPFVTSGETVQSNPTAVDANLRYLRLRFHQIDTPPGVEEPILALRELFSRATQDNAEQPLEGWRAVCVALVTAPEFSIY
jgi:hypothetical protein